MASSFMNPNAQRRGSSSHSRFRNSTYIVQIPDQLSSLNIVLPDEERVAMAYFHDLNDNHLFIVYEVISKGTRNFQELH